MEENQEQRHVCKFCNKDFACGRSLGGHMRSHMRNSNTSSQKLEKKKPSSSVNGGSSSDLVDFDASGHVGYGLRENPKKTWRLSDSIDDSFKQDKFCKECGKGFQSWKALFGHMSSHSERERVSDSLMEDDYWIDGNNNDELIMDSQSETETAAPRRRRRTSRARYKNTTTVTASSSFSFANASSSITGVEHEQEEVAMSLMMLSRDVGYWGGLNSVGDSSENNSLLVEVRSSSLVRENCNVDHIVKVKKVKHNKLKSAVLDSENARFERKGSNSHFVSLRNGSNKLESDVSLDGPLAEYKFKKPKRDEEDWFEVSNVGVGKSTTGKDREKCTEAELGRKLIKEVDDQTDSEGQTRKFNSSKRIHCDTSETTEKSLKKLKCDAVDSPGKSKYECTACNKIFHSYQALGGHRASHKRTKGCFAWKTESSETSIEINASPDSHTDGKLIKSCSTESPIEKEGTSYAEASYAPKKHKHECPICSKVFASGQALGGHKRSHVLESSEARGNHTIVIQQQQLPEIRDLLDLNLPAPVEEESNGRVAYKPWWIGNNHKHEQAVGLTFN